MYECLGLGLGGDEVMKLKIFIPPSAPLLTGNGGSGNREWWGTPGTPRPPTVHHYHPTGAWETSRKIQFCHQPRTRRTVAASAASVGSET